MKYKLLLYTFLFFVIACTSTESEIKPEEEVMVYTVTTVLDNDKMFSLAIGDNDELYFTSLDNNTVSKANTNLEIIEIPDPEEVFSRSQPSRIYPGGSNEFFATASFQRNSDFYYVGDDSKFEKVDNPLAEEGQAYANTSFITRDKSGRILVTYDESLYEFVNGEAIKLFDNVSPGGNSLMGNLFSYDKANKVYFKPDIFASIPDHSELAYIDLENGVKYLKTKRFIGVENPPYNYGDGPVEDAYIGNVEALTNDSEGNLFFIDELGSFGPKRIRLLSKEGIVTTLAGGDVLESQDGTGVEVGFEFVYGMAVNNKGEVFISTVHGLKMAKPAL